VTRAEAFKLVAGGTVQAGGGVYLERHADRELLEHCRAGDFSYILTSRQMGKSSLMIRTAERLASEGALPVVVDLTEFGAQTSAEQWYKGFLTVLQEQLKLRTPSSQWWAAQADHAFGHRFTRYLREVAIAERSERLVVFVDEIDTTLRLNFTDDFFTSIRFLYQHRAAEPDLERLSFVLIGVATPGDLIKDVARTPFNIGHRIELTDFTLDEAAALGPHLPVPEPVAKAVIGWTHRWTGGHPYLTLRTIRSLAESPPPEWTAAAVDERVNVLFFREGGETDSNLQFVRDMLTKKAFNREAVLGTYWKVRRGDRVPDLELDQVTSWLKLSGIVKRREGQLEVRNPVYAEVFDERWAREHQRLNVNWRRRLARLAAVLLVLVSLVTIPLAIYAWALKTEAEFQALAAGIERDEANRQRLIAERAQAEAEAALQTARNTVNQVTSQVTTIADEVSGVGDVSGKDLAELTARVRTAQDEALKQLDSADQRLGTRPAAPGPRGTDSAARSAQPKAGRATTPPPVPAPSTCGAEEAAIKLTLRAYEQAYASRSVEAIGRVQRLSSQEARELKAALASLFNYDMKIDAESCKFTSKNDVIVTAQMVRNIMKPRQTFYNDTLLTTFTMEKRGVSWMIVGVRCDSALNVCLAGAPKGSQ